MLSSSSTPTHDSSLYDRSKSPQSTDATVSASAAGMRRFELKSLPVAGSLASMRLQAMP
jgi:hypothetical protein